MKKYLLMLVLILSAALLVTACGGKQNVQDKEGENAGQTANFPVTVKDANGRDITIDQVPQRIVSVTPSNTEILFALGLADQIVGVTSNDDYPAEAKDKEKVGDWNLNAEKIVSLEPDLVVAMQSANGTQIPELEKLGLKVLTVEAQSVEDIYESIRTIGTATGKTAEAEQLISQTQAKLQAVQDKVAAISQENRKRVFMEISTQPLYTVSKGSLQHQILEMAGGINVVQEEQPWMEYNDEAVLRDNPDAIIVTYPGAKLESIAARPGWNQIQAVKDGKIILDIDANILVRPTSRVADGVEAVARFLYPELFQ
ncbi:MAG: ABC transporter substrate-binding protein [Bacillota bacterium]